MVKGSVQEKDRTVVNIYTHSIGAPQYNVNVNSHRRRNWKNNNSSGDF